MFSDGNGSLYSRPPLYWLVVDRDLVIIITSVVCLVLISSSNFNYHSFP